MDMVQTLADLQSENMAPQDLIDLLDGSVDPTPRGECGFEEKVRKVWYLSNPPIILKPKVICSKGDAD